VPAGHVQFTKNDATEYTYGNTKSYNYGNSHSFSKGNSYAITRGSSLGLTLGSGVDLAIGASVGASIGATLGIAVGPEFGLTLGPKWEVGWTNTFSWTGGEYRRTSDEEIILDSKKPCILTGGEPDRSIITLHTDYTTIAFDPTPPVQVTRADTASKAVMVATAAVIGGLAAAQSVTYELPDSLPDEYRSSNGQTDQHDFKLGEFDTWSDEDGFTIGIAATTVIGSVVSLLLAKSNAIPQHDNPSAQLKVKDNEVEIYAGAGNPIPPAAPGDLRAPGAPGPNSTLLTGKAVTSPGWLMKTAGTIDFEAGAGTPAGAPQFSVKVKNQQKLLITDTDFKVLSGTKIDFNGGTLKVLP
jgi:hypothetical protein